MKTSFKSTLAATVASPALVIMLVSPAMAVSNNAPVSTQNTDNARSAVCVRLDNLGSTSKSTLVTHVNNLQAGFDARLTKIASDAATINQKITTAREKAANTFQERIQALEEKKGLTETQIAAIETFKTSVQQAEQVRQDTVDAARNTYQTGLTDAVTTNQERLVQAANAYQVAADEAFQTASANCGNGEASSNLKSQISAARQVLTQARNTDQLRAQIQELIQVRNDAIKAANDAFRAALATYKADLVAVLTADSETSNQ
jgi:predicted component of viral defense system (DUF524 family)